MLTLLPNLQVSKPRNSNVYILFFCYLCKFNAPSRQHDNHVSQGAWMWMWMRRMPLSNTCSPGKSLLNSESWIKKSWRIQKEYMIQSMCNMSWHVWLNPGFLVCSNLVCCTESCVKGHHCLWNFEHFWGVSEVALCESKEFERNEISNQLPNNTRTYHAYTDMHG